MKSLAAVLLLASAACTAAPRARVTTIGATKFAASAETPRDLPACVEIQVGDGPARCAAVMPASLQP